MPDRFDAALIVTDESMAPTLMPGDLVAIRLGGHALDGAIVCANVEGLNLRRAYRTKTGMLLTSDNGAYRPISIEEGDTAIIGTACGIYRRI